MKEEKRKKHSKPMLIRFTEADAERLRLLAEEHGVSMSRVVRVAVSDLFEYLDEQATPSPSKKKRSKK
ncbi:hypothetical protein WCD74_11655 [Actinomycetospora sp. OC33-EN08]|uniref:Ribbon-helix-helix protein, CopG family n=1 Tax=Actinomycetospora aurantiaca TaxID=3129233 RepID=A0ABU8MNE3_9PSEU